MRAVTDPASGDLVGLAEDGMPGLVQEAVTAAADAQPTWAADAEGRVAAMSAAADRIDSHLEELAVLLTREQGKPLPEARREVGRAAIWLRHYASLDLAEEAIRDDPERSIRVVRRPVGVVAAITPWNFPISLLAWKLAPAFRAGDTVIAKPSPYTPLTTLLLGAILQDVLPPGVLSVVTGGADVGEALVRHPRIDKVAFTGSIGVGREIMRWAGPGLKRVTLELGGNDAAIVLDDADPDAIAERLYWSAFTNCGQVCIAAKRLLVPRSLAGRIVGLLADLAHATKIGPGLDPGTQLGPLNNAPQRERVVELVAAARDAGATIVAGGRAIQGPGLFHEPTVVTDIAPDHPLVTDEQFGPVLPVLAYDRLEDALAIAEAGPYGLGASIWTADPDRAEAVADRLSVGTVWVNHHGEAVPDAPFGGRGMSGVGYENGMAGLDAYVHLQTRNVRREPARAS
jgi:acyl-CoA reductase-like NAD-dependent aldehyde dehydrogenase